MKLTDISIRWDGRWFGFHINSIRKWGCGIRSRDVYFAWLYIQIGYNVSKRRTK